MVGERDAKLEQKRKINQNASVHKSRDARAFTQYHAHTELRAVLRRFLGRNCVHNFHFRLRDAIALVQSIFCTLQNFSIFKTALALVPQRSSPESEES